MKKLGSLISLFFLFASAVIAMEQNNEQITIEFVSVDGINPTTLEKIKDYILTNFNVVEGESAIKFSPIVDISSHLRTCASLEQKNLFDQMNAIPLIVRRHDAKNGAPLNKIYHHENWPQSIEIHFHPQSDLIQNKEAFDSQFCAIVNEKSGKTCSAKK